MSWFRCFEPEQLYSLMIDSTLEHHGDLWACRYLGQERALKDTSTRVVVALNHEIHTKTRGKDARVAEKHIDGNVIKRQNRSRCHYSRDASSPLTIIFYVTLTLVDYSPSGDRTDVPHTNRGKQSLLHVSSWSARGPRCDLAKVLVNKSRFNYYYCEWILFQTRPL